MKNIFIAISILFFITSCSQEESILHGNKWDIASILSSEKTATLSQLYDSIQYIPLETTDSSLLAARAYVFYADEENLLIRSKNLVYRFNEQGKFLNTSGQIGNGPAEYSILYSISVDKDNACLLFYVGQKKIQFWNFDGTFQKEINLQSEGEITNLILTRDHKILAENRTYSEAGLKTSICYFNLDGELLYEQMLTKDNQQVNIILQTVPILYPFQQEVKYKDLYTNQLLRYNHDSLTVDSYFDLGIYTPTRELIEDVNQKQTLMNEYAQIVDIKESNLYFYLLIIYEHELKGLILDKEKGCLVGNQSIKMPQQGGGIPNDYLKQAYFWPSYADGNNQLYGLIPAEQITTEEMETIQEKDGGDTGWQEDANPVVIRIIEK